MNLPDTPSATRSGALDGVTTSPSLPAARLSYVALPILLVAVLLLATQSCSSTPSPARQSMLQMDDSMRDAQRFVLAIAVSESLQPGLLDSLTATQVTGIQRAVDEIAGELEIRAEQLERGGAAVARCERLRVVIASLRGLAASCAVSRNRGQTGEASAATMWTDRVWSAIREWQTETGEPSDLHGTRLADLLMVPSADPQAGSRRLDNTLGLTAEPARSPAPARLAAPASARTNGRHVQPVDSPTRPAPAPTPAQSFHVLAKPSPAPDAITVQVTRDDAWVMGAAASFYCFVNDVELGGVGNGGQASFRVPAFSEADYTVEVTNYVELSDNTLNARARPGDALVCQAGPGLWWGPEVRDLRVFARYPLRVCIVGTSGRDCTLDGHRIPDGMQGVVELPVSATSERVVRMILDEGGVRRPVFASVGIVPIVVRGEGSELSDHALLQQVELARLYHFSGGADAIADHLSAFRDDLEKLPTSSCTSRSRDLVAAERRWAQALFEISQEGVLGDVVLQVVEASVTLAAEFVFTGSVTRYHVAGEAMGAAAGVAWTTVSRWGRIADLEAETQKARDRARRLVPFPEASEQFFAARVLEDQALMRSLIGHWRCDVSPIDGMPYGYRFDPRGTLRQVNGLEEQTALGTYIVRDGRVRVRWSSGGEEVATCSWRRGQLRYTIEEHSDRGQIGDVSVFERPAD